MEGLLRRAMRAGKFWRGFYWNPPAEAMGAPPPRRGGSPVFVSFCVICDFVAFCESVGSCVIWFILCLSVSIAPLPDSLRKVPSPIFPKKLLFEGAVREWNMYITNTEGYIFMDKGCMGAWG